MTQSLEAIYYHGNDQKRVNHTPASAVANGEIVDLSGSVGICTDPEGIDANALGALATDGKFKIKKEVSGGVTFTRGDIVGWDDTNDTAVSAGAGDFDIGECLEDAADADDHVKTIINYQGLN